MIRYHKILSGLLTVALILGKTEAEQGTGASSENVSNVEAKQGSENSSENAANTESEQGSAASSEDSSDAASEDSSVKPSEAETNSETEAEQSSESSSENASKVESETELEKNTESSSESEAESNTESSSESESEKNTESSSESEVEKNTESSTETESEESTETVTETETESETETENQTETETQTETANAVSEEDPDSSVPADVFKVILPTIPEDDTTFDYILDPQGLIELTDAKKYGGTDEVAFEHDKTLYFKTSKSDDGRPVYDNVSNALTVTNMSSREVQITVKATITSSEGITMSESSTFDADDTSPSIYLALTDGTNTIPITSEDAVINAVIDAPEDAYETVWDGEKNVYELTDAAKEDDYDGFQTYSFWLTDACNANADWSKVEGQIPEVCVVWEVE